ncbi:MAG: M28 family metallopeptidase [Bacillota bacterium]
MLKTDGAGAYSLLKEISFERLGGSEEERRAADILTGRLLDLGLQPEQAEFDIWSYEPVEAGLEVLEPYRGQCEVEVYGLTGSTPPGGIEAEFLYAEEAEEVSLVEAEGKIILVNGGCDLKRYRRMAEAGIAGFVAWGGQIYRREDIPRWAIRPEYFKHGKIPGVSTFADAAAQLVQKGARRVRLTVLQDESEVSSQNVICEITGSENPDEVVVITAHYDSVPYSSGANDNGAGSVIIMELARHFALNPPGRTLRFIWCGSEELGLRGSFAHVRESEDALDDVKMVLNVDVAGGILGRNRAIVTGPDALKNYVEVMSRRQGVAMKIKQDVYSSDSIPFAEKGIPSLNLIRSGAPIHNRHDKIEYLSAERLEEMGDFALRFLDEVDRARVFPFDRQIPDGVQEKLDKYLKRRRGDDDDDEAGEDEE